MADISKITLPSGSSYDLKDAWAREQISNIVGGNAIVFKGVSSVALTDGGSQIPKINDVSVAQIVIGDLYFYNREEFIYGDDNKWHSLGPQLQNLGNLAYKNSIDVKYSKTSRIGSTFSGAPVTTTFTPSGTITGGKITGQQTEFKGAFTPGGSITQPTFTGAVLTLSKEYTPTGTISQPSFVGKSSTFKGSYTPSGSISTPTISVKTAGSTATIKNPTKVTVAKTVIAAAPSSSVNNEITYYNVTNQNLTLYKIGYTTGDSITTSNVTVKTSDAQYQNSTPDFSGSPSTVTVTGVPNATVTKPTFTGQATTISMTGTPSGTVSQPLFYGDASTITTSGTPACSISPISFTGTMGIISITPTGTVTNEVTNVTDTATVTYS